MRRRYALARRLRREGDPPDSWREKCGGIFRAGHYASWEQTPWDEFWGPAEDRREVRLDTGMEIWTGSGSDEITGVWQGTNVSFSCSANRRSCASVES